jgi:hypothetical protein
VTVFIGESRVARPQWHATQKEGKSCERAALWEEERACRPIANGLYCATTLLVTALGADRGSRALLRDGVSALPRRDDRSGRDLVLIHRHDLDRLHAINE